MICPKCGAALADGTKFCNVCGAQQEQPQQPQFNQPVYQQPTYAQQVYQDRQKAMEFTQPRQEAAKPKKKFPVLAVVIAAAVLAVCVAALVLGIAFGKKTVYLMSEQVTESNTGVTTYSYEYTDDGKLLSYAVQIDYNSEYSYLTDMSTAAYYTYDKKGNLETVEFELDGKSYEYEYVYDKKGNLEGLEGDGQEFKIKCDSDGRITSVKNDDGSYAGKYSYHENGVLKKVTIQNNGVELEYRYNEQGKQTSTTTSHNGSVVSNTENEYDEDGRLVENTVESYYAGTLQQTTTTKITFEEGLPVVYEVEVEGEGIRVSMTFETEDEGLERSFELADFDFPEDMGLDAAETEEMMDQILLEMVYDEQGNQLEMNMEVLGETVLNKQTISYVAVKVPRNFTMIYQHPMYFLSIDADYQDAAPAAPAAPPMDMPATEAAVPEMGAETMPAAPADGY